MIGEHDLKPREIHIFSCEFYPHYKGGRVERMRRLVEYLQSQSRIVRIHTFSNICEKDYVEEGLSVYRYSALADFKSASRLNAETGNRSGIKKKIAALERWITFPDRYAPFILWNLRAIFSNFARNSIVIVSGPWFSCFLIPALARLMRRRDLVMVLDYRDLWTGGPFQPKFHFKGLQIIIEKNAIKNARYVAVTTQPSSEFLQRKYGVTPIVVENGVTAGKAQMLSQNEYDNSRNSQVVPNIVYVGNLGGFRNCREFFSLILRDFDDLRLDVYGDIDLQHAGVIGDSYRSFVYEPKLTEVVASASLLLIVIREAENAKHAVPGKVYEYMAAGRPIIIFAPTESACAKLLRNHSYPHLFIESEAPLSSLKMHRSAAIELSKAPRHSFNSVVIREEQYAKLLEVIEQ